MKDKKPESAKPDNEKTEKKEKRRQSISRVSAAIVTVLLIILALIVFMLRDRLNSGPESAVLPGETEDYNYETGSGQVFGLAGNGAAVASNSAIQLLDAGGHTVFKQVVAYSRPAVFGCGGGALFCNIGGRECVFSDFEGQSTELECRGDIISADINASGYAALVTEESGYKGLVSVYDSAMELIYKWWSGTGYILKAVVSPDNADLAVLCVDSSGGSLRCFSVADGEERFTLSFEDEIVFDMGYMGGDTLCLISEEKIRFISAAGDVNGEYELGDYYLTDYELGQEFIALLLNVYRTDSGGMLVTVDRTGNLLGWTETERNVISLSASERELLVMTSGDLSLYSMELGLLSRNETLMTAKKALLRESGDILLMSAYSAEKFSF